MLIIAFSDFLTALTSPLTIATIPLQYIIAFMVFTAEVNAWWFEFLSKQPYSLWLKNIIIFTWNLFVIWPIKFSAKFLQLNYKFLTKVIIPSIKWTTEKFYMFNFRLLQGTILLFVGTMKLFAYSLLPVLWSI